MFSRPSIFKGCRRSRRSVCLPVRRSARPLKREGHIDVRIVVWPTVSMSIGSGSCCGVFSDCRCNNLRPVYVVSIRLRFSLHWELTDMTDGRSTKLRRGGCVVDRRQRCRSGDVRSVGYHVCSNESRPYYYKLANTTRWTARIMNDCVEKQGTPFPDMITASIIWDFLKIIPNTKMLCLAVGLEIRRGKPCGGKKYRLETQIWSR